MSIQDLSQGNIAVASQIPFYDTSSGCDRRTSVSQLITLLQGLVTAGGGMLTQYASPNATAFSIQVLPPSDGASVYLLMTPLATYAAGTIVLPTLAQCIDGQELLVSCTQIVTALTVSGNGATVNGAPTTLAANGFFRLRFNFPSASWARVG